MTKSGISGENGHTAFRRFGAKDADAGLCRPNHTRAMLPAFAVKSVRMQSLAGL
jgi:hypothetical protein